MTLSSDLYWWRVKQREEEKERERLREIDREYQRNVARWLEIEEQMKKEGTYVERNKKEEEGEAKRFWEERRLKKSAEGRLELKRRLEMRKKAEDEEMERKKKEEDEEREREIERQKTERDRQKKEKEYSQRKMICGSCVLIYALAAGVSLLV